MNQKITRFLWGSLVGVLLLCVGVFALVTHYILTVSDQAITTVVNTYMEGMNTQLQRHFQTLVDLRLAQVDGIVQVTPPESVEELDESVRDSLATSGRAREFIYMALYDVEGEEELIYGDRVELVDSTLFLESMNRGEKMVTVGTDAAGQKLILYGISVGYPHSVGYPLPNGGHCTALVVGLPIGRLNRALSLGTGSDLIFTHIIRPDGEFVVKNADIDGDNCFDWLRQEGEFEEASPQQVVDALRLAVERREDYSLVVKLGQESYHAYCSPLQNSQWTMVTVMPHGVLEESVSGLGTRIAGGALLGCALLLLAVLAVFFIYFRLSRGQMRALDAARGEAEHANQAKSEFLANMSHDIRTPMNAIVGMTAIATANFDKPEQVKDCLRKITLSSRHLLGLINDVLDMSKIESGKLTLNLDLISLREVTESIVSIVQPQIAARKQSFDIFIQDIQEEQVYCDGVRLNQVLINLLSNALKFTPAGGRIEVTISQETSPKGENYVRTHFWVKDTGIGMSPEFQKRLFDSFAREDNRRVHKIEGSGLGMAITKYIIDAMQGTIQVNSQVDVGTQFHITLDLERFSGGEEQMALPGWDILVVDDDAQLCSSAAATLEEMGLRAEWAQDGTTALKMAQERHRTGRDYHIVLLDWKMPGMDGIEVARKLREAVGGEVPILLISAYDWSGVEEEALAAGVSGFLSKPLFRSTLYYGLSRFLPDESQGKGVAPAEETPDFTGRRLLVAEDNEINWEIAQGLLSPFGFQMDWAENGQVCVELFLASPPGYYDAVLMDLRMPVLDGYGAARAIRACQRTDAGVPIIAMTADAFSEDIQRCLECGMNAHTAKPLDTREVLRLLQKWMAEEAGSSREGATP